MSIHYCPQCGRQTVRQKTVTKYECSNCGWQFWNNPKTCVAVIFVDSDNRLLFSKRRIDPNIGYYDFPGGFLEYGESPEAACVREIKEETGVEVLPENLQFIAAYAEEYIPCVSVVDMIYIIRSWYGDFQANDDSAGLEWHPLTFMKTDKFVPHYQNLHAKLAEYLAVPYN